MDIINYIKTNYPKVIFNPVNIKVDKQAIGFIITDTNILIGYISKDGNFCKAINPIDINTVTNQSFLELIKTVPRFANNESLKRFLEVAQTVNIDMIDELKKELKDKEKEYQKIMMDKNGEIILIKKQYTDQVENLEKSYKDNINYCREKILYEKDTIIESIKKYKEEIDKLINKKTNQNELIENIKTERENIENRLKMVIQDSNQKDSEIEKLNGIIKQIKVELEGLSEENIKEKYSNQFKKECINKLMNEKDLIIDNIKDYSKNLSEWMNNNNVSSSQIKKEIGEQYIQTIQNLDNIIKDKELLLSQKDIKINELEKTVNDIKQELANTITEQLTIINKQELPSEESSNCEDLRQEINKLKDELEQVKKLLNDNNNTVVSKKVDLDECFSIFHKFININNILFRKKQIISILDNIITKNINIFTNLDETTKNKIKEQYNTVRNEIYKHIDFLNLSDYINDPNITLFKSKQFKDKISDEFCSKLQNINIYWDMNVGLFREQDSILTNLYEDLSGAVRVYIRIKPNFNKDDAVYINTVQNKKQKNLTVDCGDSKKVYGDFYGIFDTDYKNVDVYTGIPNSFASNDYTIKNDLIEENETVSPGLFNSFKQVEDGYSIVIFGYAYSGAGKTFTLLGEQGQPGLIHYGLANLKGIQRIKIKNIFEQYINDFKPTLRIVSGNIHNLVGKIKQLDNVSFNEHEQFQNFVSVNYNDFSVNSLQKLISGIEKYRISENRIKSTPNNPVSSRSHLYIVFEVTFESGKIGYITMVDMAGYENPIDIFNTFVEPHLNSSGKLVETNLTSILSPIGGSNLIKNFIKDDIKTAPQDIYDLLREGFYINETINHLVYYFNKKNYKTTDVKKQRESLDLYNPNKYFVNPKDEESRIDSNNNSLMIPIMNYLDRLSNKSEFKPTKFICICCIRQEPKYCNQILKTFEFADKVKST